MPFIGQIWHLTSLPPGGRNRVNSNYRSEPAPQGLVYFPGDLNTGYAQGCLKVGISSPSGRSSGSGEWTEGLPGLDHPWAESKAKQRTGDFQAALRLGV